MIINATSLSSFESNLPVSQVTCNLTGLTTVVFNQNVPKKFTLEEYAALKRLCSDLSEATETPIQELCVALAERSELPAWKAIAGIALSVIFFKVASSLGQYCYKKCKKRVTPQEEGIPMEQRRCVEVA